MVALVLQAYRVGCLVAGQHEWSVSKVRKWSLVGTVAGAVALGVWGLVDSCQRLGAAATAAAARLT
jgi:hypothetical protein